MASNDHMRTIGRRGGLRGGPARAKRLSSGRRSEIAKQAAAARCRPTVLTLGTPKTLGALRGFVAQYKNGYAQDDGCDPVEVLWRALTACRKDAGLARMLPVFVFRARAELLTDAAHFRGLPPEESCVLGYVIDLTCRFGKLDKPVRLLRVLQRQGRSITEPFPLFKKALASPQNSLTARSWKLVTSESDASFETYFEKVLGARSVTFRRMPLLRAS